jgi:ABC-type dipeptide/oligopeptide/nickel transport system ATPase component
VNVTQAEVEPLLRVRNLQTYFFADEGITRAVDGVSFDIKPGKTLGIVGESGCGKSVTARSILRIVERPGRIVGGEIQWCQDGRSIDLAKLPADGKDMRQIRGGEIGLVFQEPMTSFSPVHTIGNQIVEAVQLHDNASVQQSRQRAIGLMKLVGIPRAEARVDEYAYQLSGGLRQRAMIAMALAADPRLLIADEPTTALDVTTQAQILQLMRDLQQRNGMAIMLITHDLGVIAEMADDVVVMYLGEWSSKVRSTTSFTHRSTPTRRRCYVLFRACTRRRAPACRRSVVRCRIRSTGQPDVRFTRVAFPSCLESATRASRTSCS